MRVELARKAAAYGLGSVRSFPQASLVQKLDWSIRLPFSMSKKCTQKINSEKWTQGEAQILKEQTFFRAHLLETIDLRIIIYSQLSHLFMKEFPSKGLA